jgi:sirohydrochlorin cobaltochelatase
VAAPGAETVSGASKSEELMTLQSDTWLVLYAHGSKDPRWLVPFEALRRKLEAQFGPGRVHLAYLQFIGPTLADEAARAVEAGIGRLVLAPVFLSAGGHISNDLPAAVAEIRLQHPALQVSLLPPVGEDPQVLDAMQQVIERGVLAQTEERGELR